MATVWPLLLECGDGLVLVFGEDLGEHVVDAEVAADGVGDLAGVAGDHRHVDTHLAQVGDGLAGFGSDLVLERHGADDLGVVGEVEHGGAALLPSADGVAERLGDVELALAEQRRAADGVGGAVDVGGDAAPGDRAEVRRLGHVVVAGGGDDRPGEGVFALGFDGCGDAQHPVGVELRRFRRRR